MFSTRNLALAAYIIAAKKLRFTHIEPHKNSPSADICFDDPENIGKQLEVAFINGDDPLPSARHYHLELRSLRKQLNAATNAVKNGGR